MGLCEPIWIDFSNKFVPTYDKILYCLTLLSSHSTSYCFKNADAELIIYWDGASSRSSLHAGWECYIHMYINIAGKWHSHAHSYGRVTKISICDWICENPPLTHTITRHSFHCLLIVLLIS